MWFRPLPASSACVGMAARCLVGVACAVATRTAHGIAVIEDGGATQARIISAAMSAVGAGNFSAALQGFHSAALAAAHEPYSSQQYLSTQNQLQILTHGCTHGTDVRYAADAHAVVHSSRGAAEALVGVANAVLCAQAKCAIWGLDADASRVLLLTSLYSTFQAVLVLHSQLEVCRARLPDAVWDAAAPTRLSATEMHWKGQVAVDAAGQLAKQTLATGDFFSASASDLRVAFAPVTVDDLRAALCEPQAPSLRDVCGSQCGADAHGLSGLHAQRSLLYQLFQNLELALSFNTVYSDAPAEFLAFLGLVAPLATTPPFQRTFSPALRNTFALGVPSTWSHVPGIAAEQLRPPPMPLRLGVLSPDLRRHPVGWSAIGILTALAGYRGIHAGAEGSSGPNAAGSPPLLDAPALSPMKLQMTCFSFGGDDTRLVDPTPMRVPAADEASGLAALLVRAVGSHLHAWRQPGNHPAALSKLNASSVAPSVAADDDLSTAQLLAYGEALQEYRHPLTYHYQHACHNFIDVPTEIARAQQQNPDCEQQSVDSLSLDLLRRGGPGRLCSQSAEFAVACATSAPGDSAETPRPMHVLLDLAGITAGGRPQLLRERAAPVQLHYMGSPIPPPMPGTTDWFAADVVAMPPDTLPTEAPAMLRPRAASHLIRNSRRLPAGSMRRSVDAVVEHLYHRVVATEPLAAAQDNAASRRTAMAAVYLPVPFHCTALFLPQHVVQGTSNRVEGESCGAEDRAAGAVAPRWLQVQRRGRQLLALLYSLVVRSAAQFGEHATPIPSVEAASHAVFAFVLAQRQPHDVWLAAPLSASSVKREARMFDTWANILRRTADCGGGRTQLLFLVPPQAPFEAWRASMTRSKAAMVGRGQRAVRSRLRPDADNGIASGEAIYAALLQTGAPSRLLAEAAARGIPRERLIFLPDLQRELLPHVYALIDLQVDTRVYGGHSTAADALSHGVPVLTLPGSHMASRVTASFLAAVDSAASTERAKRQPICATRPSLSALLTTHTLLSYEHAATRLACRPQLRHALREFLRRELTAIHTDGKTIVGTDSSSKQPGAAAMSETIFLPYTATPMLNFSSTASQLHRAALAALEAQTLPQVLGACTQVPFCVASGEMRFPPHIVLP